MSTTVVGSRTQYPHCPQELIDRILDEFYDSKADLLTCSLVSRFWLQRSRKHLFRSLFWRLQDNTVPRQSITLPLRFSHWVQELFVDFADFESHLVEEFLQDSTFFKLRRLTLANASLVVPDLLHSCTLPMFLRQNPELEHVGFIRVTFASLDQFIPPSGSGIKSLLLHSLEVEEVTEDFRGTTLPVYLESLDVFDVDPEVTDVLFLRSKSPFDLSKLKSLHLREDGHDAILKRASLSLNKLFLFPPSQRLLSCLDLSLLHPRLLPNLIHLTIGANDFKYDAIPDMLTHFSSLLASSDLTFPHLGSLIMIVKMEPGYPRTARKDDSVVEFLSTACAVMPSLKRMALVLQLRGRCLDTFELKTEAGTQPCKGAN
ncbi:hypothetical protein BDP27DRAFT_489257 [Rhodocollybia butyracea]|uniref:F-box domain-containing protein n=1 Tax=Rhodocollybia butyracea TaxID=206335 RepID=A0A9P5QB71_9AGAR|nr:hypothetical protein BDP27DRAFT_489257 [Rhodocollybia butyracea]